MKCVALCFGPVIAWPGSGYGYASVWAWSDTRPCERCLFLILCSGTINIVILWVCDPTGEADEILRLFGIVLEKHRMICVWWYVIIAYSCYCVVYASVESLLLVLSIIRLLIDYTIVPYFVQIKLAYFVLFHILCWVVDFTEFQFLWLSPRFGTTLLSYLSSSLPFYVIIQEVDQNWVIVIGSRYGRWMVVGGAIHVLSSDGCSNIFC